MTYENRKGAGSSQPHSKNTQLHTSDNSRLPTATQHHPDGPGRTCATCRSMSRVGWSDVGFRCALLPEMTDVAYPERVWCLQWASRVPLPPVQR